MKIDHPDIGFLREAFAWVQYAIRHEIKPEGSFYIGGRDTLALARDVRREIINANIRCAYPYLHEVEGQDSFVEGFNALIEAVYLQVADIVTQHRKVRRRAAPDCRRFFVQRTKRQQFCPPSPERPNDSPCAERMRARRRKKP